MNFDFGSNPYVITSDFALLASSLVFIVIIHYRKVFFANDLIRRDFSLAIWRGILKYSRCGRIFSHASEYSDIRFYDFQQSLHISGPVHVHLQDQYLRIFFMSR